MTKITDQQILENPPDCFQVIVPYGQGTWEVELEWGKRSVTVTGESSDYSDGFEWFMAALRASGAKEKAA